MIITAIIKVVLLRQFKMDGWKQIGFLAILLLACRCHCTELVSQFPFCRWCMRLSQDKGSETRPWCLLTHALTRAHTPSELWSSAGGTGHGFRGSPAAGAVWPGLRGPAAEPGVAPQRSRPPERGSDGARLQEETPGLTLTRSNSHPV